MSLHLGLFFTRGVSLGTWSEVGNLEREVAIYRRLMDSGLKVTFVTYGDAADLDYREQLQGILILCNASGMPLEMYESGLFALHGQALRQVDVFKTNQTYGGELALWATRLLSKRLIARCGYMWSFNAGKEHGEDSFVAREARRVEEKVFTSADRVAVTTEVMRSNVLRRMPGLADRIAVIPNYVDTDLFRPADRGDGPPALMFVGRIAPEKNLESLLEAIRPLDVGLTLIGEGKLRTELQGRFADLDSRVKWEGNVPNPLLPERINDAGIFVLPSLYEGHPKALLEAMSCGVPVVAADSPGVRDVVEHGKTGLLAGVDPLSLRAAISELLTDPEKRAALGRNAREYVLRNYSLDKILGLEIETIQAAAARRG